MKRLVIAIDCDDVIIPSSPAIVEHYNHKYGTNVHVDQFYNEDPALWAAIDREEKYDRVRQYFRSEEFAKEVKPFNDAIKAIGILTKDHELHLVTGRSETVDMITNAMIEEYFAGMFMSVEHTGSVKRPDGSIVRRNKGEVCAAINADILIDDNLEHAKSVLESGVKHVLLYGDYGWNKSRSEELLGAVRCLNWDDVMKRIAELAHAA